MLAYRIAEFARLAGITVRTLHYYDEIGLLKPAFNTESGHRLYQHADLVRLQQILTLKWMGFALSEIKAMLDSPSYDFKTALAIQKSAVDRQISSLQSVSEALEQAIQLSTVDEATLRAIIKGLSSWGDESAETMMEYYSEAAMLGIQTRRWAYSPEEMEDFQATWQAIYDGFTAQLGKPIESPTVQKLVAEMERLISLFTGGDTETEMGLHRVNQAVHAGEAMPNEMIHHPYADLSPEVRQFMQAAYNYYQERKKK